MIYRRLPSFSFIYHFAPLAILAGFTIYFTRDFYTLKIAFSHRDIMMIYYPLRHWFTERLMSGEFPLWNPYSGIGVTTQIWATIPIDIFTPLEFILGPQYHYFHAIQLGLLMLSLYYALVKLQFTPLTAAAGAIVFFMSPWVTYFYFYFIKTMLFVSLPLSFLFIYSWFCKEDPKQLFFLFWSIVFSMFGTKLEFWFSQTVFLFFSCISAAAVFHNGQIKHSIKKVLLALMAILAGIFAHAWQLNLLLRITKLSGRIASGNLLNLFSSDMWENLLSCLIEDDLLKLLLLFGMIYTATIFFRREWNFLFFILIIAPIEGLVVWIYPLLKSFILGPAFGGALLGAILSYLLRIDSTSREHAKTAILFSIFIFYWCRPSPGDFSEMDTIQLAPNTFKVAVSALVWLGCTQFNKKPLVKITWLIFFLMLCMRSYGYVPLTWLTGAIWIPTRDNYLIDFSVSILAVSGLSLFDWKTFHQFLRFRLESFSAAIVILAVVLSASSNPYYSHYPFIVKAPPDYPYYDGVPRLKKVLAELRHSPTMRAYFEPYVIAYPTGSSLFEGVGDVTVTLSLTPKIYRDWIKYRKFGVRPEENWSFYHPAFRQKTIDRLPKLNTKGMPWEVALDFYAHNTLITRPTLDKEQLEFLGVNYLGIIKGSYTPPMSPLDPPPQDPVWFFHDGWQWKEPGSYLRRHKNVQDLITSLGLSNTRDDLGFFFGKLNNSLPRAFHVDGVTPDNLDEFMNDLDSSYEDGQIKTKSLAFPIQSTEISSYKPENVLIKTQYKKDSYLVLADLYHPFWHAKIDNVETKILPAFYLYRAIKVPSGNHTIEFYCIVPYFKSCMAISTAIILGSFIAYRLTIRRPKND